MSADQFEWSRKDANGLETLLGQADSLAVALLANSPDCLKIIDAEGRLRFMSMNGQCAMEVADFSVLEGQLWASAWPQEVAAMLPELITKALAGAVQSFCAGTTTLGGSFKIWDVSITPLGFGFGPVQYLVANSRDVSEAWKAGCRDAAIIGADHAALAHTMRGDCAVAA